MFETIDFDSHFAEYSTQWMNRHMKEYRNYDAMEEDIPRVYMAFLNEPAPWLDGLTPGSYFTQFEDPKDLVDWLVAYCEKGVPVPELLLEQMENVGKPCEKRLVALLKDENAPADARMTAIGVLRSMESEQPKSLYVSWQINREKEDELAENALDSLREMGKAALPALREALPRANEAGQAAILDILTNYPCTESVFQTTLRLFDRLRDEREVFAAYLARLGDTRALPALLRAAEDEATGYVTYIELRAAIERLGGQAPERDFSGDPQYEALKQAGN